MGATSQPQHITRHNGPWPLLDAAASRVHEQAALARHAPGALMAAAGLAVAKLALALWPRAQRITVWAGPGNNGGDGLVAARHLRAAGRAVQVLLLSDAADAWQGTPVEPADLVIDALLGIGATRAPQGLMARAVRHINEQPSPVLAVDLPTGLHPDTGTLLGAEAVRATATLSLLNLKPGCFTGRGRDHAGDIWLDTLGQAAPAGTAWLAAMPKRMQRQHATHKGSYGDVAVVGGAPGMVGAAWLAGAAALAAGAGRVYVSLMDHADPAAQIPLRPELMTRQAWWQSAPEQLAATTVVAGCGGGSVVAHTLPPLLAHAGRLVLDADALNAIANDSALLAQLQTRRKPSLLTPHPLEAARLLSCSVAEVQADRLTAARRLSELTRAPVLLKGSGTVVTDGGVTPVINSSGNAALATAGSGDVLAGWCAGLWSAAPHTSATAIGAQATWLHGDAADRFAAAHPNQPLRAAELIEWLVRPD